MRQGTILIVEDDPDIVQVVKTYLTHEGFAVEVAYDGQSGLHKAFEAPPALIILDWMLPRLDGPEFVRRLRDKLGTPVIMLTARGEEQDRITGFASGVDDYVPKPFSPAELVARVKAVLRRSQPEHPLEPIHLADLSIDPRKRKVNRADQTLVFTSLEFDLLHTLAAHPGRVFSRDELLERVWGSDFAGVDRVVDVHISKLRQKLEPDPNHPVYLLTVRGIGYKFSEDVT